MPLPMDVQDKTRSFTTCVKWFLNCIEKAQTVEEILSNINKLKHRCNGTSYELMKYSKSIWDNDVKGDNEHTE